MKNKIIINLSKDTPAETVSALNAVLKAQKEKGNKPLYLSNEDIEKLNARYDELYKKVKDSTNLSTAQINRECEILLAKYNFEVEELSAMRKVDYEIRLAEIEARRSELKPWRRSWWFRLLFLPLTNRAQDIIEERAELDAERIHGEAEKQNDAERERLFPEKEKKPSKREIRRKAREKLDEIIKEADKETSFEEPPTVPPVQESIAQDKKPLPGQMTFDDVQTQEQAGAPAKAEPAQEQARPVPFTTGRRPRPPRACRKQ